MSKSLTFPETPHTSPTSPVGFNLAFMLIAVLASGFSGYTTYLGFSYDLPMPPAIVIAIIIGLGLFIINLKIKEYRLGGDSISRPFIAFLMFFFFSFISNTNAIYTYFLQKDIVKNTQVNAWSVFDSSTMIILSAIDNSQISIEGHRVKQNLSVARKNLYNQITDPSNPGLGKIAQSHLEQVEAILGINLTRLKPPTQGSALSTFKNYADRLDQMILKQFDVKYKTSQQANMAAFRDRIIKLRELYESAVNNNQFESSTTDLMKRDLDSLIVSAKKSLVIEEEIPTINANADDIGSFQYTWANFFNLISPAAIILSIALSLMLDILTPTLSILLYRREEEFYHESL